MRAFVFVVLAERQSLDHSLRASSASSSVSVTARLLGFVGMGTAVLVACSSSSSPSTPAPDADTAASCHSTGEAASGPADTHCMVDGGLFVQTTTEAACSICDLDGGAEGDDGGDAGIPADAGCWEFLGYTEPNFGHSAATQGCKYKVSWTSTPICENTPVYFTVTATHLGTGTPVTGANIAPDVTIDCDHAISNVPAGVSPEDPPGTYKVGPIVFDEPRQMDRSVPSLSGLLPARSRVEARPRGVLGRRSIVRVREGCGKKPHHHGVGIVCQGGPCVPNSAHSILPTDRRLREC